MAQHGKFKSNHTFQALEFANGICSFHYIFNIVFYFRKLFYAPCDSRVDHMKTNPKMEGPVFVDCWLEKVGSQWLKSQVPDRLGDSSPLWRRAGASNRLRSMF